MPLQIHSVKEFDSTTYNSLPMVEEAFQALQGQSVFWHELVREGLAIVRRHNLHKDVSVYLLHRHFQVADKSPIIERRLRGPDGRIELRSSAGNSATVEKNLVPYRFMVGSRGDSKLTPLELTSGKWISTRFQRVARATGFLREFESFLRKRRLTRILGISLSRGLRTENSLLEERTDGSRKLSIVRRVAATKIPKRGAIPTTWMWSGADGCCTPSTTCKSYCFGSGEDHSAEHAEISGGHVGCVKPAPEAQPGGQPRGGSQNPRRDKPRRRRPHPRDPRPANKV